MAGHACGTIGLPDTRAEANPMNRVLMSSILTASLLLGVAIDPALALDRKAPKDVDAGAFSQDTQATQMGPGDDFSMFWWIPVEFWEASAAKQGNAADASFIKVLRPYVLVGVVRAKVSDLGAFRFASREDLAASLRVSYEKPGARPVPLVAVEDVDPDVNIILGSLRPILANAIGKMGESMYFFTLTDSVEDGATAISPYEPGALRFTMAGSEPGTTINAAIEMPVNALFVPRVCPNGKPAHVSWKVCPWDGTALKP
ncbi:MAG: hypothetical protein J0M16_08360 [Gammaproteobacteria bacterium]|nr:hypothetical protein [Gammaproteobacteria bacterium]